MPEVDVIAPEDRTLAALTHLSGLAGYVIPLGGVLAPILVWILKRDHPKISAIAKQALLLNVIAFVAVGCSAMLWITVILIPLVILFWLALAAVAIVLPIVGAVKAADGKYYRYPWVGIGPS